MNCRCGWLIVFAAAVSAAGCRPTPPPLMLRPATSRLAAEHFLPGLGNVSLQPPRGYELAESTPAAETFVRLKLEWIGPAPENGESPRMLLLIGRDRPDGPAMTEFDGFAAAFLRSHEARLRDLSVGSPETVTIDGETWKRVAWSGVERVTGAETHGVLYYTTLGGADCTFAAEDTAPHHRETLPLADEVIRSFRVHRGE